MSDKTQLASEVLRLTPPATVAGMTLLGVPLADWVQYATLAYILVLIICKIPDFVASINKMRHFKEWLKSKEK